MVKDTRPEPGSPKVWISGVTKLGCYFNTDGHAAGRGVPLADGRQRIRDLAIQNFNLTIENVKTEDLAALEALVQVLKERCNANR